MDTNWQQHYLDRINRPVAPLLEEAMHFVEQRGTAVDLGSGDLVDVKFLLSQGFKKVIAIDKELPPENQLSDLKEKPFGFIQSEFDKFEFPKREYDLINAQYSLPFNTQQTFDKLWHDLQESLTPNGIFVGQFFGVNDEWNDQTRDITFHSKIEVNNLIKDMQVLKFEEEEIDRKLASGHKKHWHLFHVIIKAK